MLKSVIYAASAFAALLIGYGLGGKMLSATRAPGTTTSNAQ